MDLGVLGNEREGRERERKGEEELEREVERRKEE